MVRKHILELKDNKSVSGDIPTKILKLSANLCCSTLADCFNTAINDGIFPHDLKLADIVPVFKKKDPLNPENYRPISLLPVISKVFEKILHEQMSNYMDLKLSIYLCGFRKGYSTQHSLLNMIEKWKNWLDKKGGIIGSILMDLSKAYDCIPHDLLIAKLEAYGFSRKSLKLLNSYLNKRHQRVRVGSKFSNWLEILLGVPQGSILGPILFNIFINDLFLFIENTEICNFADDNTLYTGDTSLNNVIQKLNDDLAIVNNWFEINSMVANPDKFQVIFLGVPDPTQIFVKINNTKIFGKSEVDLLGITLDYKLSFRSHIKNLCQNANNKISTLIRFRKLLSFDQTNIIINSYILSYFLYCPLIWMFCGKMQYNQIEKTHKRALKVLHLDYSSSYRELLEKSGCVSLHVKHLQHLMTEIYKTVNSLNPLFMKNIFKIKEGYYTLRNQNLLKVYTPRTEKFGVRTVSFKGSLIWNTLPNVYKQSRSINIFKNKIKHWEGRECSCHICK